MSKSSQSLWFFVQQDQPCGPVSADHVCALVASGVLKATDYLRSDGMATWATVQAATADLASVTDDGEDEDEPATPAARMWREFSRQLHLAWEALAGGLSDYSSDEAVLKYHARFFEEVLAWIEERQREVSPPEVLGGPVPGWHRVLMHHAAGRIVARLACRHGFLFRDMRGQAPRPVRLSDVKTVMDYVFGIIPSPMPREVRFPQGQEWMTLADRYPHAEVDDRVFHHTPSASIPTAKSSPADFRTKQRAIGANFQAKKFHSSEKLLEALRGHFRVKYYACGHAFEWLLREPANLDLGDFHSRYIAFYFPDVVLTRYDEMVKVSKIRQWESEQAGKRLMEARPLTEEERRAQEAAAAQRAAAERVEKYMMPCYACNRLISKSILLSIPAGCCPHCGASYDPRQRLDLM